MPFITAGAGAIAAGAARVGAGTTVKKVGQEIGKIAVVEIFLQTEEGQWIQENVINKAAKNPVIKGMLYGGAAGGSFGFLGGPFTPITVIGGTTVGTVVGGLAGGVYWLYDESKKHPPRPRQGFEKGYGDTTFHANSISHYPFYSDKEIISKRLKDGDYKLASVKGVDRTNSRIPGAKRGGNNLSSHNLSEDGFLTLGESDANGTRVVADSKGELHYMVPEIVFDPARHSPEEQNALKDVQGSVETFQNDTSEVADNIDDLSVSVGDNLNPKVKGLTESVEQFGEVADKVSQQAVDKTQSVSQEEKKPQSVADSENKNDGGAEDDNVKLAEVFGHVAGGLSTLGYDLKGVGNFEKAINKIQVASKLGKDGKTDSTEAYIEGIGNLMMGVGANIGGDFGNALSSTASMALTGLEIAGGNPIGAVIGGAVGLISSIFGGDDEEERKEAEREKIRQQIYQGMLSRSLSGSGPYSLKMLRESNWDYDKLKKRFGNKDEEELIKYQNRLELLDDIGASLEQIGSPEIVRSIDQVRAKYEYAAKSVKGMLDIASAEMTEISAQVFGLTADNLVSMFDSAIETAEDAGHAGRLIAEALELQIVDSFKKLAISQAINEAVMPMLQPILNELVAGALSGGLSPGEMADLVLQAQEIAASVAPAVSSLYGAFDEAGVLNYSYSSTPFESQGSYNRPVITGGTGVASGQQNDTRGDRPVQVVVQVANHEFETMVTELADNVFVRAERRKGVVNAQKVFG
ncbi:hypothetical protein [Prosthecochloris sp.]|uniref:hypothetical protein n=1 Tax=Prosthecochloris sp. TaxID=290513 RepID=UPI00257DAFC5|nr:hypothetical protein [Prosthecochloris sp.]